MAVSAFGQVDVNATAGTASASYTTLREAFTAINAGSHQGAIVVSITANTTEGSTPATLNSSGAGAAVYTSVLVRPTADGLTVSGNPAQGFGVIQLNGADNVTIDGDNPNSAGINRDLTISNTAVSATTFGSAVRVATSAAAPYNTNDNISIKNLILLGNVTDGNASGITSSSSSANNSFGLVVGPNGGASIAALNSVTNTTEAGVTINGLVVENNSVNQCGRGIVFLGSSSASSTSVTITGNTIGETGILSGAPPYPSPSTTVYAHGIYVRGTTSLTVSGNIVQNILSYLSNVVVIAGIDLWANIGSGPVEVRNNSVVGVVSNSLTTDSPSPTGILIEGVTGPYTVSGNTVTNVQQVTNAPAAFTSKPTGILAEGSAPSGTIELNKVSTIYSRSNPSGGVYGINLNGGSNVTVRNNFVFDINEDMSGGRFASNLGIFGIRVNTGTGHKIHHNSVHLFGTPFGSANRILSAAFAVVNTSQTGMDVRNNIFSNLMTGGATDVAHVSMYLPTNSPAAMNLTLNNNDYHSGPDTTTQAIAKATDAFAGGRYLASDFTAGTTTPSTNLRALTTTLGPSTNDDSSKVVDPQFVSSNDLHIGAASPMVDMGATLGINIDIDGDSRTGSPDIGADETNTTAAPSFAIDSVTLGEGDSGLTSYTFTVTKTGSTAVNSSVDFETRDLTATVADNDYEATSGTLTFGPADATMQVTVDVNGDTTAEADETFTVHLSNALITEADGTGTIANDDADVTVAVSPSSVSENSGSDLVYTFTRTGAPSSALTVNFNVSGTASSSTDYTLTGADSFTAPNGTVTFAAGSSTATVTIDPTADNPVEPDETVILTVAAGTGYNVGTQSSATGTITNDDTDVTVAVSPSSVAENSGTDLLYTFTRSGVTSSALTVNFTVGGTADSATDYTMTGAASFTAPNGTVTFAAGSPTATVTIDPAPDNALEPDETVILTVAAGTGYNVGSPDSATGTITNDDAEVTVAVSPSSVAENSGTDLVYTFTRNGATSGALTVNFTVGGTADSSTDYALTGAASFTAPNGTVTFAAGNSTATVIVDPTADNTLEPDETVSLTVTSGTGYNVGSPDSATATIANDDTDVTVTVAPSSVAEDGGTNLVYTFSRSGVTSGALTVNFTVGGTADPSTDYVQTGATTFTPPNGSVTFADGNSTATVTVDPTADSTVEPDETVSLTVAAGTGYNIGSPDSATGTIATDDSDVSVAVSPASVTEDGTENLEFTFTRDGNTAATLTVNFSVGGTAEFGPDYSQSGATTYTTTSGTVTFTANSTTAVVTVDPTTDSTFEENETVILTITAGAGYDAVSPTSATGTIDDDDGAPVIEFTAANYSVSEATAIMTVTVKKTGLTALPATVNYATNSGTATAGSDYTETSGTLVFAPGDNEESFEVPILPDSAYEGPEQFNMTLSVPVGATLGPQSTATGTITNDDAPPTSLVVTKVADTNDGFCSVSDCSLREAVQAANFNADANTITFSLSGGGPHVISLTLGELAISESVTITGLGADVLTVQRDAAAAAFRIFFIDTGDTVTISGLTISNGRAAGSYPAGSGAGIFNRGDLTLASVAVSGNTSDLHGAGLYIEGSGSANVANSTFDNNQVVPGSTQVGGGLMMSISGSVTVTNSTFSNNSAPSGGGLMNNAGTLTITNSTIVNNAATNSAASGGGGIRADDANTNLGNTIVANNTSAALGPDLRFTFSSQGYNLIENTSDATITGDTSTNITGQDPALGALQDNGGPTFTHAPDPGSPVIDKGKDLSATGEDQRESMRPVRYLNTISPAPGGDFSDIGAVELAAPGPCTPAPANMDGWWPGDGNANDVQAGNHGTLQNGASFASGQVAQGFQFDGVDDVVSVPTSTLYLFSSEDFTIDTWVNFADVSGNQALVARDEGGGANNKWIFWLAGPNLAFHINTPSGGGDVGVPFSPVAGRWYHVAVTRSGGDTYKFYVDGVQIGTDQINNTEVPLVNAPLTFGWAEPGIALNGRLDEVEIFSAALAPADLAAIYNAGAAGKCKPCTPPPDNMVSWWSGDGHPNDIQDGNHGTLVGGATY